MDSVLKTVDGKKVHPSSLAKNIADENGINLQEHLDLIYTALKRREIKRIYTELEDVLEKENPSTFEILSAMADNTIAFLSVENNAAILQEIGARLGGVLLLFKKTSVYFSSGVFFTYRYGDVFKGVSGLGGESFVWFTNTRTIHSYHSGSANTLQAVNTYEKIGEWGGTAINARLTQNDGTITIPAGVNHILVNAYVVIESVEKGDKFLQIFKNNSATNLMIKQYGERNLTLSMTDILLEVNEGDSFDLRVYSNSLDTLRFKHLTIEIID